MTKQVQKWGLCLTAALVLVLPPLRRWGLTVGLALVLAGALHPVVERLTAHRIPRWAAITVLLGGGTGLGVLLLWTMADRLCSGINAFSAAFGDSTDVLERLETLFQMLPGPLSKVAQSGLTLVSTHGTTLLQEGLSLLGQLGAKVASALPRLLFRTVIVLLGGAYALWDWAHVKRFLLRLLPSDWRKGAASTLRSLMTGAVTWLRAQGIMAAVQFGLLLLGFFLLGVHEPIPSAGLVALTDALPLLGSGTVLVPWAILLWLEGKGATALGFCGLWLALWASRTALEPRFLGKKMGTNAFTSLIVLYLGLECFGVWGLLGAPVLLAVGMELARQSQSLTTGEGS